MPSKMTYTGLSFKRVTLEKATMKMTKSSKFLTLLFQSFNTPATMIASKGIFIPLRNGLKKL